MRTLSTGTVGGSIVERLGVRVARAGEGGLDPAVLLGLALRDNPRRAQLLVSTVLGKHVPTDPRLVRAAGRLLGALVADVIAGTAPRELPVDLLHAALRGRPGAAAALPVPEVPTDALVLGFAETATALGHGVAETLRADYLHSTRRRVAGHEPAGEFVEAHSHAVEHLLLPADPALLAGPRPLVLVDDELSTGTTVVNTIRALHAVAPREHYVVAALVDARPDALSGLPDGVRVDVVALARARVHLPSDLAGRAAAIRAELGPAGTTPGGQGAGTEIRLTDLGWPAAVPVGGRHGFGAADHAAWDALVPRVAAALTLGPGTGRVLVLGTEELMALPLRLAVALADAGHDVAFSSTTRSPAFVIDAPDYALTSGITFPAPEGPGVRSAYNIAQDWEHVIVVVDPPADTEALRTGLLAALAPHARRITLVVTP